MEKMDAVSIEDKNRIFQEKIKAETKEFVADLLKAEELMIPCRNFVRPQYNQVRLEERTDPRSISVLELFEALNIPKEKLEEIYQDGSFTEQGKQKLVDLIGKKINFYYSPEQFHVDPETKETFEPKIKDSIVE